MSIGQELLNVPMGDMIREMAFAIADAQIKLDENSIEVAEMMGGLKTIYDANGNVTFTDSRVFFGREKVTLSTAVEIYNTSNNPQEKKQIETDILEGSQSDNVELKDNNATEGDPDFGKYQVKEAANGAVQVSIPQRLSMMELGFTPPFYQFVDTIIEVRMAISMTREFSSDVKVVSDSKRVDRSASLSYQKGKLSATQSKTVTTTNVNASYASKYSYSAEGSSLLRTKLTPIPPPPILEERIRRLMDSEFNA